VSFVEEAVAPQSAHLRSAVPIDEPAILDQVEADTDARNVDTACLLDRPLVRRGFPLHR
jgi:hypothetical protein